MADLLLLDLSFPFRCDLAHHFQGPLRAKKRIEEGDLKLPLPDRRVSTYVQSHFYLDEFPQSTDPLDENPRPHTQLGAQLEDDYVSADDGYQGRPFPQLRRPSFLGPGPDTDSEGPDEAFRRDGFDAPRPPPAAPSSSVSARLGEAVLRGGEAIIAAVATGVGQAVERFGFRNAELAAAQVEQHALPRIIGRPADAEQLIVRAGQRAQEVGRAAAQDIETFAVKAASSCPCLLKLPAQTVEAAAAEAAGGGILAAAGGAAAEGAGTAAAAAFPMAEGLGMAAGVATGGAAALAGGAAYGLYQGGRWLLSGNGGASSSGSEFPDVRTLNGVQQGTTPPWPSSGHSRGPKRSRVQPRSCAHPSPCRRPAATPPRGSAARARSDRSPPSTSFVGRHCPANPKPLGRTTTVAVHQ